MILAATQYAIDVLGAGMALFLAVGIVLLTADAWHSWHRGREVRRCDRRDLRSLSDADKFAEAFRGKR